MLLRKLNSGIIWSIRSWCSVKQIKQSSSSHPSPVGTMHIPRLKSDSYTFKCSVFCAIELAEPIHLQVCSHPMPSNLKNFHPCCWALHPMMQCHHSIACISRSRDQSTHCPRCQMNLKELSSVSCPPCFLSCWIYRHLFTRNDWWGNRFNC